MIARIARLLLTVCLLAGWQSALLHPLRHVDANGRLVHISDSHSKPEKRPSSDPSSKLCDALAALTACAAGATPLLALLSLSQPRFAAPAAQVREASTLTPRSRDPPPIS